MGLWRVGHDWTELNWIQISLIDQLVKNLPSMQDTPVRFLGEEIHWRSDRLPTPVFLGFPCGLAGKESVCNAGDLGLIPGLGRSPGEGKSYPLQYSDLENSMGCIVHGGLKKSDTTERLTLSLLDCPLVVYRNATDFCWFYSFQLCWINFSNRFVCICAFVCMYNL